MVRKWTAILLSILLIVPLGGNALAASPGGNAPGGSSSSVTWNGATTITSSATQEGQTYSSTTADENALLIDTSDAVKIDEPTVTKSGGTSASDNYSFYGINSGIMVKGGGTTTITGGTVTTSAAGANGVFSYGANSGSTNAVGDGTTVNISGTVITTTGNGSGGIMTTYGGTTNANNLIVTTSGGSSAPIRTDRGGGWVTVNGGSYTSSGLGSPAIYSTAEVVVSDAELVSEQSEGVCIEGTGSIELNDCSLTATNSGLNGNATFYDTIMIYQSMSGDADSGSSQFTMTGGTLTSNNGHVFHVTNTNAVITLSGVTIVNNDAANVLLSVCDDGWSGGSNIAALAASEQTLTGDLLVGSDSTLTLSLANGSTLTGTVSGAITNGKGTTVSTSVGTVNVTLDDTSKWYLTGDTYITSFSGTAANVITNGYTLYVNGTALSGTTESESTDPVDEGFIVTFTADAHCAITVYKTQAVDSTDTVAATIASGESGADVSRSSTTGEPDSTGDGQVNFVVTVADGYTIDSVAVTDGTYKNIKLVSSDETTNTYVYRVTKITAATAVTVTTAAAASEPDDGTLTLTFSDSGIVSSSSTATGYTISGTTLTISAAGEYVVTGACSEGNIVVKKGTTGVKLTLQDLTLACSTTAPLACNKTTEVTLTVSGTVTLTDNEDPANETSSDATVADAFEGAAIKAKSGATLTITGDGTLNAIGAGCKNGIKGGAEAAITVDMGGTLIITAANNGLAADGSVMVKSGTLHITAGNEGIKSEPDTTDTASAGTITISGGSITIDAASDGIQGANGVTITGGTFEINADNDGIQSNADLTIMGGTFRITTLTGYADTSFNGNTMSCKGLKASASDDDTEDASNTITITGGTFTLNTADDAIHSDGYIVITGGTFDIYSGDDGIHADTSLTLGSEDGLDRDPCITVNYSYEGLEAGNVYIYGGKYYVRATDDGVNAAGGSSNGSDPGAGGGNHFNPGGGPGGSPGSSSSVDYAINIYGGSIYVNADGDGLDSNGALNITGGSVEVWAQTSGGDNDALDCDGALNVGSGATVFAAGSTSGADYRAISSKAKTVSVSKGSVVTVKSGGTTIYQTTAPKAVGYVYYSGASSYTVSTGSSMSCTAGNAWSHSWNDGVVTTAATTTATGVTTYTCTVCGATETETIPMLTETAETSASGKGDVNGDGLLNAKDVTTLRRGLAGGYGVSLNESTADVNGDGGLNAKDATFLRRYLAGGYGVVLS